MVFPVEGGFSWPPHPRSRENPWAVTPFSPTPSPKLRPLGALSCLPSFYSTRTQVCGWLAMTKGTMELERELLSCSNLESG